MGDGKIDPETMLPTDRPTPEDPEAQMLSAEESYDGGVCVSGMCPLCSLSHPDHPEAVTEEDALFGYVRPEPHCLHCEAEAISRASQGVKEG